MDMDKGWFEKKIAESPYGSVRQTAKHMRNTQGKPMDPTALSRTLLGDRSMQLDEARQLADLLGVPMSEVIRRAGVPFGKRDNLVEE